MVRVLGKDLRLPDLVRPQSFDSKLRSTRLTSQLGIALGIAFAICFLTGLISHLIQHPPGWFSWPSRPAGLYRFTQGLHVATGLACVPLLGAKLWSVYPRLFERPLLRSTRHAAERASVAVLVAAALFQVVGGILNVSRWYGALPYFFTAGHYWVAWSAMGALLIHVGVKLPLVGASLAHPDVTAYQGGLSRRGLLTTAATAAGVITVTTVGQTISPLASVSVLAPRWPTVGPQGLPVNKTAAAAAVGERALDPSYRLVVAGPEREIRLAVADLAALRQHTAVLPIACVEGWSATGIWSGVRLRELAELIGVDPDTASAEIESLERAGRYRSSQVTPSHLNDSLTLIALRLNGAVLHLDNGYPARLIAPNRPGVLQTKWVSRITIRNRDGRR